MMGRLHTIRTLESETPYRVRVRRGFTLLELIIVIIILAVLVAFLLPATRRSREPARRSVCKNNLKQIGLALHNYNDKYGAFPPAYTVDAEGKPLHSWRTLLLPFLDEAPLYEKIDLSKPWDAPENAKALASDPQVFKCPSVNLPPGQTTYLAVVTPESFFRQEEPRKIVSSREVNSENVMVIEVTPDDAIHWMQPVDADAATALGFNEQTFFAHAGCVHGLYVDGHVSAITYNTPADERRAMRTYPAE